MHHDLSMKVWVGSDPKNGLCGHWVDLNTLVASKTPKVGTPTEELCCDSFDDIELSINNLWGHLFVYFNRYHLSEEQEDFILFAFSHAAPWGVRGIGHDYLCLNVRDMTTHTCTSIFPEDKIISFNDLFVPKGASYG